MYDAIIVGARCAGAPTAMLLARRGYRVLLLDKAGFPSDTLSVHYIHQPGIASLKRWGLLDSVVASNCPPVHQQTIDFGPFALTGAPTPLDGVSEGYAPRRTVLDKILVDAAATAEFAPTAPWFRPDCTSPPICVPVPTGAEFCWYVATPTWMASTTGAGA